MKPENVFPVPGPGLWRLVTMAAPQGGNRRLAAQLAALRSRGFDVLVCALTDVEQTMLGLATEAEAAREAGLEFLHLPIDDFGVPHRSVVPAIMQLALRFTSGAHLVVHLQGRNRPFRAPAAAILVLTGCDPGSAFQAISDARGCAVPETEEQRAWVYELAALPEAALSP